MSFLARFVAPPEDLKGLHLKGGGLRVKLFYLFKLNRPGWANTHTGRIPMTQFAFSRFAGSSVKTDDAVGAGANAQTATGALLGIDPQEMAAFSIPYQRIFRTGGQAGRIGALPAGRREMIRQAIFPALHETDHGDPGAPRRHDPVIFQGTGQFATPASKASLRVYFQPLRH